MNAYTVNAHASVRVAHIRRWFVALATLLAIVVSAGLVLPAQAAEQVSSLPFVNNFATARFKLLGTIEVEGMTIRTFGEGNVVMPDRTSAWVGSDASQELVYVVQVGKTIYQRIGAGEWQQADDMVGELQTQPLSAQFNQMQQYANSIQKIGTANVGNTPTTHYQVWLSGDRALAMTNAGANLPPELRDFVAKTVYKYDFWIGQNDSFLYQQNVEVTTPAMTIDGVELTTTRSATLMTFFDINNPNVSVNAPQ